LVFVEEFYMMSRMNAWGFYITWNKLSFDGDSEFGTVISIIGVLANIYSLATAINDLLNPGNVIDKIKQALAGYGVESWLFPMLDQYFGIIVAAITLFNAFRAASNIIGEIIKAVIDVILAIFNPSIEENLNVLNKTMVISWATVRYQACWIPWFGDSWGASISVYA
ncbi:MAG: hypothetical protein FWF56_01620, partial [Firmicutes bacterium]|nr:hypothetical protein [Bacillota bacterium]